MGGADDLVMDAVAMGAQMLYFKMKNNHRAKALQAVGSEHGLSFCQKAAEYHGEIDRLDPSEHMDESQGLQAAATEGTRSTGCLACSLSG